MIATIALAALFGTAPRPNALPSTPAAHLTFHHATYRDCAWRRPSPPVAAPPLDSCASITATWPALVRQPGIEAHLRTHLLSTTGQPTAKPLAMSNVPASLRQALQAKKDFAQQTFTVSPVTNRQGVLVLQNKWTYDGGGAHPDQGVQYYTYDTAHDRVLTLPDLFVAGYATRLVPLLRQAFSQQRARYAHHDLLNDASDVKLTTDFLPTHQGIRFHYNAGEAGAVAAGPVEVLLTWQQLGGLLRPASIVRAL